MSSKAVENLRPPGDPSRSGWRIKGCRCRLCYRRAGVTPAGERERVREARRGGQWLRHLTGEAEEHCACGRP